NLDHLMLFVQELGSLFAESSYNWQEVSDYSDAEKYQQEMAILGVGLSPHPLKELMAHSSRSFTQIEQLVPNVHVTLLAQVTGIRVIRTKTGQQMAFLKITDTHHSLDVTVFPETYQKLTRQIKEEAIYYLMGKTQERDGRIQLILNELEQATTEKYWIQLQNHDHDKIVARILKQYPGNIPVVLHYQDSHETLQSQTYFVSKTPELDEMLRDYVMKTVFR
ncbi:OB-fold nucleic acid binding domain-containing protein, partial [Streptococcus pluranimalium]